MQVESPKPATFYVDPITKYVPEAIRDAQARRTSREWCHLWTDGTPDDLHAFAARIGMKRAWFQNKAGFPHYDLVPSRRAHAIRLGAQEMHLAEWIRMQEAKNPEWRPYPARREEAVGIVGVAEAFPRTVLATLPAPLIDDREERGGNRFYRQKPGRTTVRLGHQSQATLDLFAAKPAPLASRLQPLLLFAARFVERHARRGEDIAEGSLALEGREQHLDADLHERMESAVLEVMTNTLARCAPGNLDLACAAFYRPGRNEASQWCVDVTLWNQKKHGAPRRAGASL